ncbi:MAG: hypothetical protein M3340_20170, partial [Actinomycetota bacterium]|nr:hypothetical protein [Actinomycetota bacterium]
VDAVVAQGRELVAQACRRTGSGSTAQLDFELFEQVLLPGPHEPASMVRVALGGRSLADLEATGLDVTHDVSATHATVVVYSADERARLLAAGFEFDTVIADMRADDLARLRADRAYARSVAASPLPSGRDGYRTLADYSTDIKALADKSPSIARRIEIGKSIERRPIEGLEIAGDVRGRDGRPVFAVLGAHHAREWPSAEMPMEFAQDLVQDYGKDPRVTSLLDRVRVIALPMMNPDGFNVSRTAGPTPADDDPNATLPLIVSDGASYKRKNCRPTAGSEDTPCISRPALQGVDLNRNYGAYWGGVGSSDNPGVQQYRGPAPYSEPEAESFHKLSSTRSIVTVISHHTFWDTGIWLRQPGFCPDGDGCTVADDIVPDEAGMKALGDAMGTATGWESALGWVIGEITGATEDWNYFAQGAYGYTPEQRGPNFHPNFENAVVKEYVGTGTGAKGGVREALLLAGEQAANPSFHSVLLGVAPAGNVLRLRKDFVTDTSQPAVKVQDKLDFTTTVPDSGFYNWHVNQSTRPLSTTPESYTLTCETPGGQVLETRQVTIARGETQALDLACGATKPDPPTPTPPSTPGQLLCADTRSPVSSPTRGSLAVSRARLRVRGRAADHGCRASGQLQARRGALARVLVAVAKREGKRCRFLRPSGRFSGRRSCSRALYVPAKGLKNWSLTVKGTRLARGRYWVWSRSADVSGNVENRRRRILGASVR